LYGVSGELLIMVAACSYLLASPCGVENEKIVWYRGDSQIKEIIHQANII